MNAIRNAVEARNPPFLVHFTRTLNLPSILTHGIVPRQFFDEQEIAAHTNDPLRLDKQLGATCLSIAFPNAKMLWKLRQDNPGANWAVLVISREILWELPCAFCPCNAAANDVTCQPINNLKSADAFGKLYDPVLGIDRAGQKLRDFDPTDVQAEILAFGTINPNKIIGAVFQRGAIRDQYQNALGERKTFVHGDKGFFSQRWYFRGGQP